MEKIKTAFIGVGYRGKQLLQLLQTFPVLKLWQLLIRVLKVLIYQELPAIMMETMII